MKRVQIIFSDREWMKFFKKWMLVALVIHLVAAFFSVGFHHHDEHFQIVEFINLKWGGNHAADLPWEFQDRMRPWLQPLILYVFVLPWKMLGVENSYFYTTLFRLLSAILGWGSLVMTGLLSYQYFGKYPQWRDRCIKVLSLLWFLPYFHVRASGDNWGAIFFIMGICFYLLQQKISDSNRASLRHDLYHLVGTGIFFGLAFQFRFQICISIFFFTLWIMFFTKEKFKAPALIVLGFVLIALLGIWADTWGYGSFTFSQWNYLYNDYKAHIASTILPNPWWDYFRFALLRGIPPISLFLILGVVFFWIKKPKDPLTFATLFFFVIHSAIAHKELRYLMPVIYLSPLMTMWALALLQEKQWLSPRLWKIVQVSLVAINFVLLPAALLRPANSAASFYHYLETSYTSDGRELLIHHIGENPFIMVGYPLKFYQRPNYKFEAFESVEDYAQKIATASGLLFTRTGKDFFKTKRLLGDRCRLLYSTYPGWLLNYNVGKWVERSRMWALYDCH